MLTKLGKEQCAELARSFPYHDKVDLLVASPLRRTIQTAVLSFGPVLSRKDVPFLLHPNAQEVSERNCNVGFSKERLTHEVPTMFEDVELDFDVMDRMDFEGVIEGWNSKVCSQNSCCVEAHRLTGNRRDTGLRNPMR
jgi:hypothetical protein